MESRAGRPRPEDSCLDRYTARFQPAGFLAPRIQPCQRYRETWPPEAVSRLLKGHFQRRCLVPLFPLQGLERRSSDGIPRRSWYPLPPDVRSRARGCSAIVSRHSWRTATARRARKVLQLRERTRPFLRWRASARFLRRAPELPAAGTWDPRGEAAWRAVRCHLGVRALEPASGSHFSSGASPPPGPEWAGRFPPCQRGHSQLAAAVRRFASSTV